MEDREPFVAGQMHAVVTFLIAFIAMHPDKAALKAAIDATEEIVESRVVAASVPEATLEGSRDVVRRFQTAFDRFQGIG